MPVKRCVCPLLFVKRCVCPLLLLKIHKTWVKNEGRFSQRTCTFEKCMSYELSAMQKKRPKRIYPFKCNGRYGRWKGTKNYRKKAKELELPGYK